MKITRASQYSILAILAVDRAERARDAPVQIRDIAGTFSLPADYTARLLTNLVHAGLLRSQRGRDGGFRLRRPPNQISVLDVLEAADGPLEIDVKLEQLEDHAELARNVTRTLSDACDAMRECFAVTTLADLLGTPAETDVSQQ